MTDIIEIDQSFDASKIINKLTVVGMGPGSTHLEVTVEDAESQSKYGIMEGTFSAKGIHDIDTLTSFANATLKQTKEAKHRMTVKLVGTERTDFELGDTIHIAYPDAGIDGDYRIISMERVSGVEGEYTKLEVTSPQFRVTETLMDAKRRLDAEDYHPQGAAAILTLHESENVDPTHSLMMEFYIPEEAVDMGKLQIKEAHIALKLKPFRAYSTGAASGGGAASSSGGGQTSSGGAAHTHTVSGQTAQSAGEHRHTVFDQGAAGQENYGAPDVYDRYEYVNAGGSTVAKALIGRKTAWPYETKIRTFEAVGSHAHSVTGTTSAPESSHTHTVSDHDHWVYPHTHGIVYGIYTSTSPADVYIKLNGQQIAGPYNADEYVDITTAFLNQITTYGWNTLEFTTTQLGKIGATLFMRLFLQAR